MLIAMKRITNLNVLSAIVLSATLTGCMAEEAEGEDAIDDVGVASGKADGTAFSACELKAVVTMLNGGATLEAIRNAGVAKRSATRIVQARDGGDKKFGTADDKLFADIQAVDAVPYVGPATIKALVDSVSDSCATNPGWWLPATSGPARWWVAGKLVRRTERHTTANSDSCWLGTYGRTTETSDAQVELVRDAEGRVSASTSLLTPEGVYPIACVQSANSRPKTVAEGVTRTGSSPSGRACDGPSTYTGRFSATADRLVFTQRCDFVTGYRTSDPHPDTQGGRLHSVPGLVEWEFVALAPSP